MKLSDFKSKVGGQPNSGQNITAKNLRQGEDEILHLPVDETMELELVSADQLGYEPFRLPEDEVEEGGFLPKKSYHAILTYSLRTGQMQVLYQSTGAQPEEGQVGAPLMHAFFHAMEDEECISDIYRVSRCYTDKQKAAHYVVTPVPQDSLPGLEAQIKRGRDICAGALKEKSLKELILSGFKEMDLDTICRIAPSFASQRAYHQALLNLKGNHAVQDESDTGVKGQTI